MPGKNLAPVCGLYCATCEYLENQCPGCGYVKGRPFWTIRIGVEVCPFYDCCINKKQLEHCGLCEKLPCQTFEEFQDPSLTAEQARDSLIERQGELLRRKDIGTEKWLEDKK